MIKKEKKSGIQIHWYLRGVCLGDILIFFNVRRVVHLHDIDMILSIKIGYRILSSQ